MTAFNDTFPIVGMTPKSVVVCKDADGGDAVRFTFADGSEWLMHHSRSCCEYVGLTQVDGDLADLVNSPLVMAECAGEIVNDVDEDGHSLGTSGWTFYRFATGKGYVTLRWQGNSNGYYSVEVSFYETKESASLSFYDNDDDDNY